MKGEVLFGGEVVVLGREVLFGGKLLYWEGKFMQREKFSLRGASQLGSEVLLTESKVVWSAEGMFLGSFSGKVVA